MQTCYLTCARGLEKIAQTELEPFVASSHIDQGGVQFEADLKGIYNINLRSRIGMHALIQQLKFNAKDTDEIYNQIYNFSWTDLIDYKQTFMVKVRGKSNYFKNNQYTTLRIKDAIVDRIKKDRMSRPSINKENPDVIVSVFIIDDCIKVYLDSSGTSLHKRGYRNKIHRAALNESLAAGLILLSDWNHEDPFYDLMCGSGTIPIEAALIAHHIAPGIFRKNFGFQNWNNYDEKLFTKLKKKATSEITIRDNVKIHGSDLAFQNIAMCLSSAKSFDIQKLIEFKKLDIKDFKGTDDKGTVILNPPYGERLQQSDEDLAALYELIGDVFKNQCPNFDAYVFTSNLEMIKRIGLKSEQKNVLKNGRLDCRFIYYPISSGRYS